MKLNNLLVGIIIAFMICNLKVQAQNSNLYLKLDDKMTKKLNNSESFELKKIEILNGLKYQKVLNNNAALKLDQDKVYTIIGITAIAGFFASVIIFKEEIFGTIPVSLLAVGVLFIILGN
ncbi:MAG: hypothetical protein ABI550_00380 [Ignavibacteriaceae bacterium]